MTHTLTLTIMISDYSRVVINYLLDSIILSYYLRIQNYTKNLLRRSMFILVPVSNKNDTTENVIH